MYSACKLHVHVRIALECVMVDHPCCPKWYSGVVSISLTGVADRFPGSYIEALYWFLFQYFLPYPSLERAYTRTA